MRHFLLGLLMLAGAMLRVSTALASGFASPAVGPTNNGVTSSGPLSVHFNPAGLGYSRKVRLMAGGALILGDLRYQRERRATYQYEDSLDFALPIDPSQIDPNKTGLDVTVKSNPVGVMPALFLEVPIGPVALGFGMYVPYAAKVSWPKEGPQRWQLVEATMGTAGRTARSTRARWPSPARAASTSRTTS